MNYCRKICNKKGKIDLYMDKDWLYEQYVTLEKSLVEIGEICDVYDSIICNWLRRFNIKIRTNSEAQKIAMNRPELIELNSGDTNPHWKGNDISYSGIHAWIGKNKPRPLVCEICGKEGKLELSNKTGK